MNAVDIIILVIIALNAIIGAVRGATWQIFRLAGIALGVFGAMHYGGRFLDLWPSRLQIPEFWGLIASWVVVFLSIYLVVFGITQLVKTIIDKVKLGSIDRFLGAMLGAAKGGALCGIALYLIVMIPTALVPGIVSESLDGDTEQSVRPSVAHRWFLTYLKGRIDDSMPSEWQDELDEARAKLEKEAGGRGK